MVQVFVKSVHAVPDFGLIKKAVFITQTKRHTQLQLLEQEFSNHQAYLAAEGSYAHPNCRRLSHSIPTNHPPGTFPDFQPPNHR